jgi:hypothetical protein
VKREDLALILNERRLDGYAAEVGVSHGDFSQEIMSRWNGEKYFMIDAWKRFPGYNDLCDRTDEVMEGIYKGVVSKFGLNNKAIVLRGFSAEVGRMFQDEFFDFVYIDADHTYKSVKEDIATWFPKVKAGGIMSGHDYKEGMGVIQAVTELVQETGLKLNLTEEDYASWWVIK